MGRPSLKRPSCIVQLVLLAIILAAFGWLVSGYALRTPNPSTVTKETPTYDTDVPSQRDP
jgi:lipopolysaccharide export system protein LptC